MSNRLIEIYPQDWIKLSDLYCERKKEPSGYELLRTITNWISKDPELNIKIFALDGDWQSNGTFVFVDYGLHVIQVYLNTVNGNLAHLLEVLKCLKFGTVFRICGAPKHIMAALRQYQEFKNIDGNEFKMVPTVWYYIEREKAINFDTSSPNGFTLSKLDLNHAALINEHWPHRAPGSVVYVERLVCFNDNVGVFDPAGNLVAWCLRLPLGCLGMLTVLDTHKRYGLGSLIVRYMSKIIAYKNEEVMAPVVTTNIASRALFDKLGFSVIDQAYWCNMK